MHIVGETAIRLETFINEFISKDGQYPSHNFRTSGWIRSSKKMWWGRLVGYMLDTHEQVPKEIGLYRTVRNV